MVWGGLEWFAVVFLGEAVDRCNGIATVVSEVYSM